MRILMISHMYPSPVNPTGGIFVHEQVKALPEPLAREVLDFIGFLRERGDRGEWRDLMNAQASALAPVWDEDKVWESA